MTRLNALLAAALISTLTAGPAFAGIFAEDHPGAFEAEYPNRDVLNGGALTPAGRMGLELPGGAAPLYGTSSRYARMGSLNWSSCAGRTQSIQRPCNERRSPATMIVATRPVV
jgi:hypothetical protein